MNRLGSGLANKVAVVTGGSRGIGAATCRLLAASGARVVVNGRDRAAINNVVRQIRDADGEAVGIVADCTRFEAVEELRMQAEWEMGPVDILMAFAGHHGAPSPTEAMAEEQWRFVVDANLTATFVTVRSFLPGMVARGGGAIVTMASSAGRQPGGSSAAYAAAKAGVVMFSRHLAGEVGPSGVRVNCLAPSAILTERMLETMPGQQMQELASTFPLRRIGAPDDVARAALFLASENASWLTGVTLDVAGGRVAL